jgi:hypothetical protein
MVEIEPGAGSVQVLQIAAEPARRSRGPTNILQTEDRLEYMRGGLEDRCVRGGLIRRRSTYTEDKCLAKQCSDTIAEEDGSLVVDVHFEPANVRLDLQKVSLGISHENDLPLTPSMFAFFRLRNTWSPSCRLITSPYSGICTPVAVTSRRTPGHTGSRRIASRA